MNEAQKRLAKKVLSMNSSRRDKKQDLNSSLYDKRTFNEVREGLADYPADKLKNALSGYITDPIFITNVTNDNGNITVNYRFLDENLNEEFVNAEIGYGLDYIENIHLFSNRQDISSGRKPMVHRLKSVNSSKMTADQAKQKYKELLTQCYISVYDHKLDVNDPQVVEYRKQMNDIKAEFGDVANTMDGYTKSLDKKYKNSIDFTSEDLDSGLFSKKEKPSEEILKMYKQLKKSIDNLIKAGTPASNSNLKNMQNKATEFEKKYDSKALKMALAASRRGLNCSDSSTWDTEYFKNYRNTLAALLDYDTTSNTYEGELIWIDKDGELQSKKLTGKYNPKFPLGYKLIEITGDYSITDCSSEEYITAYTAIRNSIRNKKNSENSARRGLNSSAESGEWKETYHVNHDRTLASMVHYNDVTGEYDGEVVWIDENGKPQQKTYKGKYNPRLAFAPFVSYWITQDTKQTTVEESDASAYIEACSNIKDAVKNKWTSENSSRRGLNCMTERAFVDEIYYYINLIPDDVTTTPIVVKGAVEVATSEYDFTVYALTDDGKFKVSTLKGTFAESLTTPQLHENEAQLLKLVKDMLLQELGTDAFIECDDDKVVYAQINDLKDKAAFIKAQQDAERERQNAIKFEREYGVKPDEWHPFNDLLNSANSSRRCRMNSSRRRRMK